MSLSFLNKFIIDLKRNYKVKQGLFLFEVQISISRNTYKKQLKIFFEHFWLQYNIKLLHTYIFSHVILYSCIKPGCPGQNNIYLVTLVVLLLLLPQLFVPPLNE